MNSKMTSAFILLIIIFIQSCTGDKNDNSRPNIIFLLSDDQRYDAIGHEDNTTIITPNLDQLAREGIYFKNSFVTSSVCCASRVSILTGQYVRRHGIEDFVKPMTDSAFQYTYPFILRKNGYYTGFIGKWGIRANYQSYVDSIADKFDYWAGDSWQTNFWHESTCPYVTNDGITDKGNNHCTCPPKGSLPRKGKEGIKDPLHTTVDIIPDKISDFLTTRPVSKPFCLSVSFKAVHHPWEDYPDEYNGLFSSDTMPIPSTANKKLADELPAFLKGSLDSEKGRIYAGDHELLSSRIRDYYRLTYALDVAVGKIRDLLNESGLTDKTILIFSSDNGHFLGEKGLFGKWLAYEPSIRVPMIIFDPRLKNNHSAGNRGEMVLNIDIAPTILDYAGISVPTVMQGKSLKSIVEGNEDSWRNDFFYEHIYTHNGAIIPSEAVRSERFKYINYFDRNPVYEELYDLRNDPDEIENLAADAQYQTLLDELRIKHIKFKEILK